MLSGALLAHPLLIRGRIPGTGSRFSKEELEDSRVQTNDVSVQPVEVRSREEISPS
jgi:hypothetical protein